MAMLIRSSYYLRCELCEWTCTVSRDPHAYAYSHLETSGTSAHKVNVIPCTVVENQRKDSL